MGVYSLLPDETCWFLAVDLDKKSWQEDVAARKTSTLILVHRKPLLDQRMGQLALFLGLEPREIGQIGAGKARPNGNLDVAMVQSLVRKRSVSDLVTGYGQVIQDESHHCPAVSFERVLAEVKPR